MPWLDKFWKIIWRGEWHAPILTVNSKVFSQGRVPDVLKLLSSIGKTLDDTSLIQSGEEKIENSLIALTDRNGFYEYYDPASGRVLGEKGFLWTVGLIIDLIGNRLRVC